MPMSCATRPLRRLLVVAIVWVFIGYVFVSEFIVVRYQTRLPSTPVQKRPARPVRPAYPTVDIIPTMSPDDMMEELEQQIPNMPFIYLKKSRGKTRQINNSCARLPSPYDIQFNNIHWQRLDSSDGTFFFYGAYLDVRPTNALGPSIRILTMHDKIEPKIRLSCQIWYDKEAKPVITEVVEFVYIWFKSWGGFRNGFSNPYLLTCMIPSSHWNAIPEAVGIVEKRCDQSEVLLKVVYNPVTEMRPQAKFAICVKGLDFPHIDLSVRLVEWLELLKILGAQKIVFYKFQVHPNVARVLRHFQSLGLVELFDITLPGGQPNQKYLQHLYLTEKTLERRHHEVLPYNDCLYRNMYQFQYVGLLDIDEVILPLVHKDWNDMMEAVEEQAAQKLVKEKNKMVHSFNFRHVYFMEDMLKRNVQHGHFKDIPAHMHMLQHVYRSINYTDPGSFVKCFHNPKLILAIHNHFPIRCLGGICNSFSVGVETGHLQHYRKTCNDMLIRRKQCHFFTEQSKKDTTIWRYKDELIHRVNVTLHELDLFRATTNVDSEYEEENEDAKKETQN